MFYVPHYCHMFPKGIGEPFTLYDITHLGLNTHLSHVQQLAAPAAQGATNTE